MLKQKSNSQFAKAKNLFPGGVNSPVRAFKSVGIDPFIVSHGQGPYLFDIDGNRYVDYINSWGPLVLGHADPKVVSAIQKQSELGTSYGACTPLETDLAELIISLIPSIEMMRFVNSGTEAGMSVLRLARAYTNRNKIIKFSGCYHGHVDSLLVSAGSGAATYSIPDSKGVTKENASDTLIAEFNDLDSVLKHFETHPDSIAAIITEPIVGNAGFIKPKNNFHSELRRICDKYGSLLIFDEVMTGFRVALGGAQSVYQIKPDLTMLGKVIGGGLPVGAFGGKKEIMQLLAPLGPVYQAGTLSGNPLAMIAGITTLNEWSRPEVFQNTALLASKLCTALSANAREYSVPLVTDCCGTMFGFFFQKDPVYNYTDAKKSDLNLFKKFFISSLNQGIYFAQSQFEAGFISSSHSGEAIDYTITKLPEIFKSLNQ